jgi:hypothetical protein
MNQCDVELLDKQLRNLHMPPRHDGLMVLAIVAVFVGGIMIGNMLSRPHALVHTAVLEGIPLAMQQ